MKAVCWHGTRDVRIDSVPDPTIQHPRDATIKITASGICGSDLHLFSGFVPTMQAGDILGHEPMGEVVEISSDVHNLKVGDRVVIPFTIACGHCFFCEKHLFSLCDNSNPNAELARKQLGQSPSGLFGFSHLFGGFAGGQAEYLRVPFADVGPLKIESDLPDEMVAVSLSLVELSLVGSSPPEPASVGHTRASYFHMGRGASRQGQTITVLDADKVQHKIASRESTRPRRSGPSARRAKRC